MLLFKRVAGAVLVLLSILVQQSSACNSLILDDSACGGGIVSGASFSETWGLASQVAAGPPGGKRVLLPITDDPKPSTFGTYLEIKHGFVCIGHTVNVLQQKYRSANAGKMVASDHILCNQGMNSKGLAVAFQAQTQNKGIPRYDPSLSKKEAINFWDLTFWVLASFDSVASLRDALRNRVQVVSTPLWDGFLGGKGAVQWLGVYDATGAALVVQFRNGVMEVLDNNLGVFANEPGYLQDHESKFKRWAQGAGYQLNAQGFIVGPVVSEPQGKPPSSQMRSVPDKVPGGYNGDDRFVRMAVLKSAALLKKTAGLNGCWPKPGGPTDSPTSPAYVPEGYPAQNPTMLAVKAILDSVKLPRGLTDFGVMGMLWPPQAAGGVDLSWQNEATYWMTLRDHNNKIFYYQTANSYVWRSIDLLNLDWSKLGGKVSSTPLQPPKQSGVLDVTHTWLSGST